MASLSRADAPGSFSIYVRGKTDLVRTNPCPPDVRQGRLRKAAEFLDAATLIADPSDDEEAASTDAFVTLCIQAGIAASDVICCARLGKHAHGQDHNEAVALLAQANSDSARHLRVLLGMKTKAAYSHTGISTAEARRAGRAAEALVETARRVNAG
jgi:hypothetical protein